jgi:RNA polymerase sigma-70 factor, ECF subfamily
VENLSNELHTHISSLRRYAMALVGDPADADDLVQETLQKAIAYMQKGREIRNLRGYLFTILHNTRISQLRRPENGALHVPFEDVAGGLSVTANQYHRAELRALSRELMKLREEQRQVVLLVCVEGLTYREAAAVIGVPIGTVMSRLARARQILIERTTADASQKSLLKMVK